MKAIIPVAGAGTRLRPHTHLYPKTLLRVAGRPVLSYILDDLTAVGISEVVFVVGYNGGLIRDYVKEQYPRVRARYTLQEVQDGTAGAVSLAEPWADEDLLVLFADMVFATDMSVIRNLAPGQSGVIWARDVENYHKYGVIVTDADKNMVRIVEKPREPVSTLANIGLYYIRDYELLFEGIRHTLRSGAGPSGEYYLTDAFQYMVDAGAKITTAPVGEWYDAGSPESLLAANRFLLAGGRGGVDADATVKTSKVSSLARIESQAVVVDSQIGGNVTVECGACVEGSVLEDVIVGSGSKIRDSRLRGSVLGSRASVRGFAGTLNILDDSRVSGAGLDSRPSAGTSPDTCKDPL